jgi:hypothetical protein
MSYLPLVNTFAAHAVSVLLLKKLYTHVFVNDISKIVTISFMSSSRDDEENRLF